MLNIYFLGAADRFNYGDVLFPLILNQLIKKYNKDKQVEVRNYGIIKSDLSSFGGLPTLSIRNFHKDCIKSEEPVYIIIVGGEVLGTGWGRIFSYLNRYFRYFYQVNDLILGEYASSIVDPVAKLCLGGKSNYPFIINKNNYKQVQSIIYNSVGGIRKKISKQQYLYFKQTLGNSVFCSFRDIETFNKIKIVADKAILAPDSAVLMSDFYSKEWLYEKYYNISFRKENYIFFQINKIDAKKLGAKSVAEKLKGIIKKYDMPIVLCPIGTALGHEDHVALKKINRLLSSYKQKIKLIEEPNIFEIMSLIANSILYIGSSLHGIITAMSYAKPYIAIKNNAKITSYLKTWGIDSLRDITCLNNWDSQIEKAFSTKRMDLELNRKNQIEIANNSMQEMFSQIKS